MPHQSFGITWISCLPSRLLENHVRRLQKSKGVDAGTRCSVVRTENLTDSTWPPAVICPESGSFALASFPTAGRAEEVCVTACVHKGHTLQRVGSTRAIICIRIKSTGAVVLYNQIRHDAGEEVERAGAGDRGGYGRVRRVVVGVRAAELEVLEVIPAGLMDYEGAADGVERLVRHKFVGEAERERFRGRGGRRRVQEVVRGVRSPGVRGPISMPVDNLETQRSVEGVVEARSARMWSNGKSIPGGEAITRSRALGATK